MKQVKAHIIIVTQVTFFAEINNYLIKGLLNTF